MRILGAFVALVLLSCSKPPDDPDTLVINNATEPQTLDPGLEKGNPEYHVTIALFEGLTVYDPRDLSIKPGIAEKWETNADVSVYTFHLRESKWSDGSPLTARDFEWSWKRVIDPSFPSEYAYQIYSYLKNAKGYYDGVSADLAIKGWKELSPESRKSTVAGLPELVQKRHAAPLKDLLKSGPDPGLEKALAAATRDDVTLDQVGVKATDDRTLVVTLESPTPYFLDLAAFFTYFPVPRAVVEKHGLEWTKPATLVSNGPYLMKEWKPKEHILLEKNPNYWDAANVPGKRLKYLAIENASTAFNLYEKDRIHWMTEVPREYIEELLKRPDYHTGPFLTTYFYGYNLTKGVTKEKKVRQALSRAIDKEKIVKYIQRAGERVADSLVPPGLPGYTPATMASYDPEAARKLLAEAGYPDGAGFPKLELLYNTNEGHKKLAAAIQEMWRQTLKIDVELRNVEWKVYLDMQTRLEFGVIRRAWVADYNDPNTFIDLFTTTGGNNNTGFSNKDYDALVDRAGRERDPAKRMTMLHDAEAILMDELPVVPIYFYVTKNLWKPEVQGIHDNVRDTHPLNRMRRAGQQP